MKAKNYNESDFINEYNNICKAHLTKDSKLADLTNHELFIWIAGKTFKFGRSLNDSLKNAKLHMKDRKKAEQLFGTK